MLRKLTLKEYLDLIEAFKKYTAHQEKEEK